jgi:hypothetical protein
MNKKNLIKFALILGGGYLLFMLVRKPKDAEKSEKKSLEGDKKPYPAPTMENAEIVLDAYTDALKNNEPATRLTELNKECMDEFGLRCYVDAKTNQTVVCDVKGEIVLTR